jgi:hypothetical protein
MIQFSFGEITMKKTDKGWKKQYTPPKGWSDLVESRIIEGQHNRGILTGVKNNLTVFDFDDQEVWGKFVCDLRRLGLNENDYKAVQTKRGFHIYFQYDPDFHSSVNIKCSYSSPDSHIDCRNDGGMIIAPPTRYRDEEGKWIEYEDLGGNILPMPPEIKALLTPPKKEKREIKKKCQVLDDNRTLVSELIPILSPLSENYDDWIKVGMAMKHTDPEFLDLFHEFSRQSIKYDENECDKVWESIKDGNLRLGSLLFWAKNINPEMYKEVMRYIRTDEYVLLKEEWELMHNLAFIHSTGEYCYEKDGVLLLKRKEDIKNSMAPITFIKNDKEVSFFDTWNKDKTRKEYNDVGMFSPDMKSNPNILNLWKPFYCQTLKYDTVISIQPILDYFMVMANGDKDVYDYFLKYIKNMLLFPSKPQQAICLASIEQGNGKSTFFKFLEALVGRERCFETKSISTDVCGTFNGHFEHVVLTHLEDIEPEDYRKNEAELRSIINKQYMPIHHKGKKSVEKKNFNHLIMTTNYLHTVRYTDEQRRIMGVECGTDYLGNYDKFKELYRIIEDDHFLYSFYKFLLDEIECPEILTKEDMPISSLMKEGCEMNVDNIVSFVSDLEDGKYTTLSLFTMFKTFTQERGYQDKRTFNTFAKDIKRQIEKTNSGSFSKHIKNEDGKECSGYVIQRRE